MRNKKIIILAGRGCSSKIVVNELRLKYDISHVILEDKESSKIFLQRRIKRLGIGVVFGQILFQIFIVRILNILSKKRIQEIMSINNLNCTEFDDYINVNSINSDTVLNLLKKEKPSIIIVNGTRIISKKILKSVCCPILNIHAGITPNYRGVHGAYWALAENDKNNIGVTVHLVDSGIDTGNVIYQELIHISTADNFVTYPYLQISKGIQILVKAIDDHFTGSLKTLTIENERKSKLWYHPTIFRYLYNFTFKGVK